MILTQSSTLGVISRSADVFLDASNNLKSLLRISFKAYAFSPGPGHLLCQKVRDPGESGVGARQCVWRVL